MTARLERAAVLDLDESTLILIDGDARSSRRPPGPAEAFDRPVVVVSAPHGPGPERLESAHRAAAPHGVHGAGRFAACAAAAARRGVTGTLTICDLTWTAARIARAETDGTAITVGPHHDATGLDGAGLDGAGLDGAAFLAGLTPDPAERAALRDALTTDADFLSVAYDQAVQDPMYRDVPVVTTTGTPITAGALLDALTRYRVALAASLARSGAADHTVLTGDFAAFPLLARAIAEETGRAPLVVPGAVPEGALLLAAGACTETAGRRPGVQVPLHRRRAGRLEDALVALPYGVGEYALFDGAELYVAKGGADDGLPVADVLPLDVDGAPLEVDVACLPAGRYRLGVRPTRDGPPLLVLAPGDGADPTFLPLTDRSVQP
ncbi:hypothetical protein E1264_27355 [Actinomadura sp. KC216]|uniref:hypothetical protein n=1 Tax=Actinomadura sp. KC216 TaxID=2530370 RepID=UPI001048E425|nr:hypothetical protein [Actinomadura sp. KC216]TDB83712.1 hypothetical protein E1264_27355 [Actinomadura sp. KC216]